VNVSVRTKFTNTSTSGAVLVTSGAIQHQRLNLDGPEAALGWMATNSEDFLRRHESVMKKYGIWIVTKTYTSTRCGLAFMQSNSASVEIGMTADAEGILSMSPSASWKVETKDSETELYEDNNGRVVFMSGICFTRNRLPWGEKIKATGMPEMQDILRGGLKRLPRTIEKGSTGKDVDLLWTFYPPESQSDRDALSQGYFPFVSSGIIANTGSPGLPRSGRVTRQATKMAALDGLVEKSLKRKVDCNDTELTENIKKMMKASQ
jgi:hypothetical protein